MSLANIISLLGAGGLQFSPNPLSMIPGKVQGIRQRFQVLESGWPWAACPAPKVVAGWDADGRRG